MRVIGVIAEFNPFHNGHEYLIQKAREAVNDKRAIVMVVMSGPFTERGIPAILPKHVRAKQALLCGADVVLELPFTFAAAPSERFASGAVELLYRTGVVTDIAFGVDCANPNLLHTLADIDYEDNEVYVTNLKQALSDGKSFPAARAYAIASLFENQDDINNEELLDTLRQPNAILALDYLKAIKSSGAKFNIHMINRVGESYSSNQTGKYMSATGIRELISKSNNSVSELTLKLAGKMPDKALAVALSGWMNDEYKIPDMDLYARDIINHIANSMNSDSAYMGDGLSGYITNKASDIRKGEDNWDSLSELLCTKHFTMPRIYRALASSLVNQSEEYINTIKHVQFIRVLGFNKEGRYCLKIMGKCARLPIISNCSDALELYSDKPMLKDQFELNKRADNIAAKYLGLPHNYDLSTPPVITK